jgi:DNA-binding CsgD family transcriptional regulator/tetratricopeptide (TPR) repeat protein
MARRDTVVRGLLERDEQLAAVRAAIGGLRAGSGCVVVLSGPAGIGKTALLQACVEHARAQDVEVLTARGEELEHDFGHGVTRQLFDRRLAALDDHERAALLAGAAALAAPVLGLAAPAAPPVVDPAFAARHGLTWLLAGLADRRPVLLALDDAQWADPPALRWLAFLVQRLDHMAVMVLVTRRTAEACFDQLALDAICRPGRELVLAPLSEAALARLVRACAGPISADLIASCVAASGGNPFLLHVILAALDEEGTAALRRPFGGARRVGPTILRRFARLPPDATMLAEAVGVLGDGAELSVAAELAELSLERAARAADALVSADLFTAGIGLRFAHGLVRDAVAAHVGQHAMQSAHSRAAHVLRAFGAPVERIVSHLLLAPAARDAKATADLRDAARRALTQGCPTTAVTLLRRALAEPPPAGERGGVLLELGIAELLSAEPSAAERLAAAIEVLDDPWARAVAAQARAAVLAWQNREDDAVATIDEVRLGIEAHSAELALILDVQRLMLTMPYISRSAERHDDGAKLRRALRSAQPDSVGTRGAVILVAAVDAVEGATSSAVRAAVDQAWSDDALLDAMGREHGFCAYSAIALWIAGELNALEALANRLADRAAVGGSVLAAYQAWLFRAIARAGMGRLADAEADLELALQSGMPASMNLAEAGAHALLAGIAVDRGDLAGAHARLLRIDAESDVVWIRVSCATVAASLARADGAIADERRALREVQRLAGSCGFATWVCGPWPSALAVALGPCDEARELAAQALSDARMRGRPGEIGVALRAQALVDDDGPDIERLHMAVVELERSELVLEHARTLVDLGAALRRDGKRSDARQPLATGLERASLCGATALAERARIELQATGARPRRLMATGRDALTPSERRIAMLAADGRSNREIAQLLFVTSKTVETHLSRTYRKLDITGRTELPIVLAG